jgi:deferrochelatase/peroxidase EfeB
MTHAMLTIVARIAVDRVDEAVRLIDDLGNPANDAIRAAIAGAPGSEFLHFASLHAIRSHRTNYAFLVLEMSADGTADAAIDQLAARAGQYLLPIFQFADPNITLDSLVGYLKRHSVTVGQTLLEPAGLVFAGAPDHSVVRIKQEQALAAKVAELLAAPGEHASALARLETVRLGLKADRRWDYAFEPVPVPAPPRAEPGFAGKVAALAPSFVTTFLWPILLVAVPLAGWLAWPARAREFGAHEILGFALSWSGLILLFLVLVLGIGYSAFRKGERNDWTSEIAPTLEQSERMFAHENAPGYAHNHMISHTIRKPGLLRFVTSRLSFWAIARMTGLNPRPGFLGDIGTIHFARWVTLPGTRDVLFFSNFGGSWESYLEDFITKAHQGLTAAWSNTVGFPRTKNLFQQGATDGERFKRFARQSMDYTPFWYSAYPTLTTANIRTNALVRRGLAARTESEATAWLALLGSTPRPPEKLDTTQIQSIVFGGLGFKPAGRVMTIRLGDDILRNRALLRDLVPFLTFNDGRYISAPAVVTLALSPLGLTHFGLPADALETFPAAFRLGMRGEGRAHILGDDPVAQEWWWDCDPVDATLLLYGDTGDAVATLAARIGELLAGAGTICEQIELAAVADKLVDRKEPFGFVDGVSQPAIRGTYRGLRNADPIHLVEPGEIILGYPDNRGSIPPGPLLDGRHDPEMMLPIAGDDHGFTETIKSNPRLIGFNGSYLVIRQLEQDHEGFWAYCERQAAKFKASFPEPAICDAEFIAAKMMGRWPDGSSLARNPYMSATKLKSLYGAEATATMRETARPAKPDATPVQTGDRIESTGKPVQPDNDFLFGTEDPQGTRCPYGAHVRRANPRDSLSPGSMEQVEITNRHRILRIGRGFAAKGNRESGLMFMCLNSDLERQFEFIQQTWMGSTKFHGLNAETDPIAVTGEAGCNGFTIPVRTGPVALEPMPRFVTLRGGGYFFIPGRQLIRYLASESACAL